MIIINVVESVVAALGLLSSLLLLYLSGTGEIEKMRLAVKSWISLSKYLTMLALVFAFISIVESFEFLSLVFGVDSESVVSLANIVAGLFAIALLIATIRVLAKNKDEIFVLDSSVFYGKFGITLLYVAVILIAADHMKGLVSSKLNFFFDVIFLAFLPLFVFIAVRFRSYSELIRKGSIVISPHTTDVFVGVSASFMLFFFSLAMHSVKGFTIYNIIEVCSLSIFALVSAYYGNEIEKIIEAAKD
ncbi:hypothetical protein Ferp_0805 [Ferroglobus placidus DSM 10642]|uniref:Uncharacterized protein n=1 Tax=Ferroglobus placidus (strain DSM 10642 / AEDII12DO) TaxID=589924 RepID=D3RWW0_FERPA|nr:hypothetical protein [Ferroglobus placidus]ADC64973.1 hypothetical protein Ferp_0805 [Ferroglobus placidus DSM 10642]